MNMLKKCSLYVCLIALGTISVFVTSCKKDSDGEDVNPTPTVSQKTQLLTASKWVVQSITVNPAIDFGFGPTTDLWSTAPGCSRDNFFTYQVTGDRVMDEGATKCTSTNPQTKTTKWKFLDNETRIADGGDTATVVTLSSTQFVFTTKSVFQGVNYTYTTTYKH